MALEYEAALRIVRDSISTADIEGNPATFDPPAWAIRAVERAYKIGERRGARDHGLYPEGG
jgi:hypothetical protein